MLWSMSHDSAYPLTSPSRVLSAHSFRTERSAFVHLFAGGIRKFFCQDAAARQARAAFAAGLLPRDVKSDHRSGCVVDYCMNINLTLLLVGAFALILMVAWIARPGFRQLIVAIARAKATIWIVTGVALLFAAALLLGTEP